MASNNRQNVTWVEVCIYSVITTFSSHVFRVFEELLRSGSLLHICAEHGTTACGLRAITKMPHLNCSSYHSSDYHGKDELE